jgi:hypothetical protein
MTIQAMPISSLKVNGSMATPFGHCTLLVARSSAMLNRVGKEVKCFVSDELQFVAGQFLMLTCHIIKANDKLKFVGQRSFVRAYELHDYTRHFQTATCFA